LIDNTFAVMRKEFSKRWSPKFWERLWKDFWLL